MRGGSSRQPNVVLSPEERAIRVPRQASPPPVAKRLLRMNAPDLTDNVNDASRVKQALKRVHGIRDASISLPALRELPQAARDGEWVVTAFAAEPCDTMPIVSGFQAGDTTSRQYAVAVDVGTTTVEVALIDLNTGEVVASANEYNAQVARGEDVISRVIAASKPGGLDDLGALVVGTLRDWWSVRWSQAGVSAEDIVSYYVAGNTVMTHLLLRISPEFIRTSPYVPVASEFPWMRAAELGLPAGRATRLYATPCPASWLGGDIVAGLVAAGVPWTEKLTLFIDVGTNGEIVLGNSEWLVSCSCSAGPGVRGRRHPARHARRRRRHRAGPHRRRDARADDHDHRRRQAAGHLRKRADRLRRRAVPVRRAGPRRQVPHRPRLAAPGRGRARARVRARAAPRRAAPVGASC